MNYLVKRNLFLFLAYSIQESFTGSSNITVTRTHAFGNVTIYWRALSSLTSVKNDDVDMPVLTSFNNNRLADQLEETRGSVTCPALQLNCQIPIKVKEDKVKKSNAGNFTILRSVVNLFVFKDCRIRQDILS